MIVNKGYAKSKQRAKALIMAGKVMIDQTVVDKPGMMISRGANLRVKKDDNPYVSRGGLKLEKALNHFPVSVKEKVCMDIGASTGGFTDCLLKFGAKKVFAVDVGYGQLDWSLRNKDCVVVIERTNIRHMPFEAVNQTIDVVVADTSFISLKKIIPAAQKFMKQDALVLALIKPQFEAGRKYIGKGGVVKDTKIKKAVIKNLKDFFNVQGYRVNGVVPSPILGPKGNEEFIISLNFCKK